MAEATELPIATLDESTAAGEAHRSGLAGLDWYQAEPDST
jgi:hypothetical protein